MGIRDWLKTKKHAPPELTENQKEDLKSHERKKFLEVKKRQVTERYAPGKSKGLKLGPVGGLFDTMADSARMEFGPPMKGRKSQITSMEHSGLFGSPVGFGGALEAENIVKKGKSYPYSKKKKHAKKRKQIVIKL